VDLVLFFFFGRYSSIVLVHDVFRLNSVKFNRTTLMGNWSVAKPLLAQSNTEKL